MSVNVNEIEKVAVAIDSYTYKHLIKNPEFAWLKCAAEAEPQSKKVHRTVKTPDTTYHVFFWNFSDFVWNKKAVNVCPDKTQYAMFRYALNDRRHTIIELTEDGNVIPDVKTYDKWGCDEEFSYILNFKVQIFLWDDEDDIILE